MLPAVRQPKKRRGAGREEGRDEGIQGIRKCCLRAAKGAARHRTREGKGRGKKIGQCGRGAAKGEARSRVGEGTGQGKGIAECNRGAAIGEAQRKVRGGMGDGNRAMQPWGSEKRGAAQS